MPTLNQWTRASYSFPVLAGLIGAFGIGTLYSTSALAASSLCASVNGNTYSQLSLTGQGNTGDSYSFTAQNLSGSSVNIGIAYDNGDGTPFITSGGVNGEALANGASKVFTYTASTTDSNARLILNDPSGSANMTFAVTCTAQSTGSNTSEETTSKDVIASVSRSQTAVIQQNIGARVSAVIGRSTDGSTRPGSTTDNDTANLMGSIAWPFSDNNRPHNNSSSITDGDDALRRIAMMGSFDSSTGQGMQILGLGPTDRGSVNATGVDGRADFESTMPFTVWGHGSFTSVENDYVNGTDDNRYDGDVWGYNIGLDYRFADAWIVGLSLGYNDTDLTTSFNDGSYQETGWVASPYVIFRPNENLVLTGEVGYGMGNIDLTRDNGAVSGSTESDIWYAALTSSYRVRPVKDLPLSLTPSLAFIASHKTVDAYTESDGTINTSTSANTRQIKPSIEAAYDLTPTQSLIVTPFIETGLTYDFTDEINNDKTAFNVGGGVRLSDAITGLNAVLEGSYLAGRTDYTEYTIGGTVTYAFRLTDQDGQLVGIVTPFFTSNLNEYGYQHLRTGLSFDAGQLSSEIALSHMMAVDNDIDDSDINNSMIEISMSLPF